MFLFGVLGANMPFLSFRICWFQETELFGRPTMFQMLCTLVSLFWLFCQHLFFLSWGGGHVLPMLYDWYFWFFGTIETTVIIEKLSICSLLKISWIISPQFHYVGSYKFDAGEKPGTGCMRFLVPIALQKLNHFTIPGLTIHLDVWAKLLCL